MNGLHLHEYIFQLEAPLRETAAYHAAQRAIALQGQQRPFGFEIRLALGRALVAVGRAIQGSQGSQGSRGTKRPAAQSLGESANAAS